MEPHFGQNIFYRELYREGYLKLLIVGVVTLKAGEIGDKSK
jgi:hypothetical protein